MFIELTDHLRCSAEHDEAFLVLLPNIMEGRAVVTGELGCPVCGRVFHIQRGEVDFGGAPDTPPPPGALDSAAVVTLVGAQGPGGYFVVVGGRSGLGLEVMAMNSGIGIVAINPLPGRGDGPGVSILYGGMIPLKANSMRGVVLGSGYGDDPHWVREAARVALPGLRIVGEGTDPQADVVALMASAAGVWVGTKRR
jgi:hypothetical protein